VAGQGVEIGRNVDQHLEALRDAEAQSRIGAVEHLPAVAPADVDAVLLLEAALRHD
jgi:hypothetical protein